MYKTFWFLCIFFVVGNTTQAQEMSRSGEIIDYKSHKAVGGVTITIYNNENAIYNTVSDSLGDFQIPYSKLKVGYHLNFSALGYENTKLQITSKTIVVGSSFEKILLKSQLNLLKEVVINAKKRYSDTVHIDLSKQRFERSVMIDSLFSKNGFSLDSKGTLYYKGKVVSEITVDGGPFFRGNNLDIYKYLPALVVSRIDIIQTNIDSVNNSTLQNPNIKLNLELKDQYKKGAFGTVTAALGTLKRYATTGNLYTYSNKQQFTFGFNLNNVNNNTSEHSEGFSTVGNNLQSRSAQISYRNLYKNKLELLVSANADLQSRDSESEVQLDRPTENGRLFSKTNNSASSHLFKLNNSSVQLNYKITPLDNLVINQNFSYNKSRENVSASYLNINNNSTTSSLVNKLRENGDQIFSSRAAFTHLSLKKKGRFFNLNFSYLKKTIDNNEDNLITTTGGKINGYFINGDRKVTSHDFVIGLSYNEPVLDDGYIQFFSNYEKESIYYNSEISTDSTLSFVDLPLAIFNNRYQTGIKFYKLFKQFTFDETIGSALFTTKTEDQTHSLPYVKVYPVLDFKLNYKTPQNRNLMFGYTLAPAYPSIGQITNINNSFDLLNQLRGNPQLRPELKQSFNLAYDLKKTDSLSILLSTMLEKKKSTFGFSTINVNNTLQVISTANIGSSSSALMSLNITKSISKVGTLNFTTSLRYQEVPTLFNGTISTNTNTTINQSISTTASIFKHFKVSPTISAIYSKYTYQSSGSNVVTLTYSDNFNFSIVPLHLNLYPILVYNKNIDSSVTGAVNGDANVTVFKKMGTIWLRAYDLFNTFRYYNNFIGTNYTQTVKYSNATRYFMLGLNLKLNNIK